MPIIGGSATVGQKGFLHNAMKMPPFSQMLVIDLQRLRWPSGP